MKSLIVEGVSKRYWVPKAQKSQPTESRLDRVRNVLSVPLVRELLGAQEVWALKDISFDVDHGTVFGVIGGNGAGKTTLLKVIAKSSLPRPAGSAGGDVWSRCWSLAPVSMTKRRRARTSS